MGVQQTLLFLLQCLLLRPHRDIVSSGYLQSVPVSRNNAFIHKYDVHRMAPLSSSDVTDSDVPDKKPHPPNSPPPMSPKKPDNFFDWISQASLRNDVPKEIPLVTTAVTVEENNVKVEDKLETTPGQVTAGTEEENNVEVEDKVETTPKQVTAGTEEENNVEVEDKVEIISEQVTYNNEVVSGLMGTIDEITSPLTSGPVQGGVSPEIIKGAAIAGFASTLLATKTIVGATTVSLGAAYAAIHPGTAGDVARTLGAMTWESVDWMLQQYKNEGDEVNSNAVKEKRRESAKEKLLEAVLDEDDDLTSLLEDVVAATKMAAEVLSQNDKEEVLSDSLVDVPIIDKEAASNMVAKENVENTNEDLEDLTVVQLKDELREQGLKVSGRKSDLIQRLKDMNSQY